MTIRTDGREKVGREDQCSIIVDLIDTCIIMGIHIHHEVRIRGNRKLAEHLGEEACR